jgi:hypothetical protein
MPKDKIKTEVEKVTVLLSDIFPEENRRMQQRREFINLVVIKLATD